MTDEHEQRQFWEQDGNVRIIGQKLGLMIFNPDGTPAEIIGPLITTVEFDPNDHKKYWTQTP